MGIQPCTVCIAPAACMHGISVAQSSSIGTGTVSMQPCRPITPSAAYPAMHSLRTDGEPSQLVKSIKTVSNAPAWLHPFTSWKSFDIGCPGFVATGCAPLVRGIVPSILGQRPGCVQRTRGSRLCVENVGRATNCCTLDHGTLWATAQRLHAAINGLAYLF